MPPLVNLRYIIDSWKRKLGSSGSHSYTKEPSGWRTPLNLRAVGSSSRERKMPRGGSPTSQSTRPRSSNPSGHLQLKAKKGTVCKGRPFFKSVSPVSPTHIPSPGCLPCDDSRAFNRRFYARETLWHGVITRSSSCSCQRMHPAFHA